MPVSRVTSAFAHIVPFAVFLAFIGLVPLIAVENTMLPWWRHAPEQWVYPLQTLVVGILLVLFRRHYTFAPFRGYSLAIMLGIIGAVWWCLPAFLWQNLTASGVALPAWCGWLGMVERKDGFDPTFFRDHSFWYVAALTMRFLRMVVVVPFVEEIFWRSFLMRYVQADGGDFRRISFGRHTWPAFVITTLGVVLAHASKADWLGALGFGTLMYFLAVRTKSLAACVLMHAAANLLLGAYVMVTRQWGFW